MFPKTITAILISVLFLACGRVWALTGNQQLELIERYRSALAGGNAAVIEHTWQELDGEPEAIAYMEKQMPNLFASYQLEGLVIAWKKFDVIWREEQLQREKELAAEQEKIANDAQRVIQVEPSSNLETALKFPNRVTSGTANNAAYDPNKVTTATDNRIIALQFPNQLRTPNQEIIRGKIDALLGPRSKEYGINPNVSRFENTKIFESR